MTDARHSHSKPHAEIEDDSLRGRAQHAFEASRDAARATAESLEANPLGVLVGGLALGVVASALIPRTQRERDLLKPVGRRLHAAAGAAIAAARETGQRELEQRGLTRDGAREGAKSLFQNFTEALTQAGSAAAQAAKENSAV